MYSIEYTRDFIKSYKKLIKQGIADKVELELKFCIQNLAKGERLDAKYRDHKLQGELEGYREFDLRGDLLVIYRVYENILILSLIDIGTHSNLFK